MSAATGKPQSFRVGLIQMRSGRTPAANVDGGVEDDRRGAGAGADYVLTPEMTNIMELSREALFAAIVPEEDDDSLAAFREIARKKSIFVHVGSLAIKVSPEKAANRSFLIDPKGEIVARYDKIHMFDVDLADGESYRESRNYRPGELAVLDRSALGPARPDASATTCAFPRSIARSRKPARPSSPFPRPSPARPARRTGTC